MTGDVPDLVIFLGLEDLAGIHIVHKWYSSVIRIRKTKQIRIFGQVLL